MRFAANFHYFSFGIERTKLWFENPNLAGAFLAQAVIGLAIVIAWCIRQPTYQRIRALSLLLSLIGCTWLLGTTYSRGATVALVVTWLLLPVFFTELRTRLFSLALPCLVVASLLLVPSYSARFNGTSLMNSSVGNRLFVWSDVLGLIADNQWQGIFPHEFKGVFNAWYNTQTTESYNTAVNNVLTAGAIMGVLGMAVYFFLNWFPVCAFFHRRDYFSAALAAFCVCYFVAGQFSCLLFSLTLGITLAVVITLSARHLGPQAVLKVAGRTATMAGSAAIVLAGVACVTSKRSVRMFLSTQDGYTRVAVSDMRNSGAAICLCAPGSISKTSTGKVPERILFGYSSVTMVDWLSERKVADYAHEMRPVIWIDARLLSASDEIAQECGPLNPISVIVNRPIYAADLLRLREQFLRCIPKTANTVFIVTNASLADLACAPGEAEDVARRFLFRPKSIYAADQ